MIEIATLTVSPSSYTITSSSQNTVTVNFSSDQSLTDVKLSMDNGSTYKDKVSMTQSSAVFSINGMADKYYSCKLKGYYNESATSVPVSGVSLSKTSSTLKVGATETLTATVSPSNATNKSVTWSSGNSSVATVSNGTVTAKGKGSCYITVSTQDGGYTATCYYTVTQEDVNPPGGQSIVLDKTSHTITQGQNLTLTATINIDVQYPTYELRENGSYKCDAYRNGSNIIAYTQSLNVGTYTNLSIVAREWTNRSQEPRAYTDICESQKFTLSVTGSGGGGGGETGVPVTSVSLNKRSMSLSAGNGETLTATVLPSNASNKSVTWTSDNSSIATVSNGYVNGISSGSTYINVITQDGSKTDYCYVTVSGGGGGGTPTESPVLTMQYATAHNCVPNTKDSIDWKYKPRMGKGYSIPSQNCNCTASGANHSGNIQIGQPWSAFGQWATVYKENGKSLVDNVGVELTDFKMWRYNMSTSQWVLVNDTFDYGSFYHEDFWDDGNSYYPNNVWVSGDKKTYKCLMNSSVAGRCFHPFSLVYSWSEKGFSSNSTCYVVSQVKFRLIKWNESGVDNRNSANLCINVGGDYWIHKNCSAWDSQWRHNGDFAIGNYYKATSDWQYVYATSCPQGWDKGFPV